MKEMIYVKENRRAAVYMALVWVRNMPAHMRQHIELQPAAEQLPPTIVSDPNVFCDDPSLKSLGLALWRNCDIDEMRDYSNSITKAMGEVSIGFKCFAPAGSGDVLGIIYIADETNPVEYENQCNDRLFAISSFSGLMAQYNDDQMFGDCFRQDLTEQETRRDRFVRGLSTSMNYATVTSHQGRPDLISYIEQKVAELDRMLLDQTHCAIGVSVEWVIAKDYGYLCIENRRSND